MARERGRLAGHAFHDVAVTTDGPNLVIEEIKVRAIVMRSQPFFRDGHANTRGHALTERACGCFDTGGQAIFRMSGSVASNLAEILDVVEGNGGLLGGASIFTNLAHARDK